MITMQSPVTDFLDAMVRHGACQEAVDWLSPHGPANVRVGLNAFLQGISWYNAHRNENVERALEDASPHWAAWVCLNIADEVDDEVLLGFGDIVSDPMVAFLIARRQPRLRAVLRPKYVGRLRELRGREDAHG